MARWPCWRGLAQVSEDSVVIGDRRLVIAAEQFAVQRVSCRTGPRPGREDVIETTVGVTTNGSERILVGPRDATVPSPATSHAS